LLVLKEFVILSKPRGGRVEGRASVIRVASGFDYSLEGRGNRLNAAAPALGLRSDGPSPA